MPSLRALLVAIRALQCPRGLMTRLEHSSPPPRPVTEADGHQTSLTQVHPRDILVHLYPAPSSCSLSTESFLPSQLPSMLSSYPSQIHTGFSYSCMSLCPQWLQSPPVMLTPKETKSKASGIITVQSLNFAKWLLSVFSFYLHTFGIHGGQPPCGQLVCISNTS